ETEHAGIKPTCKEAYKLLLSGSSDPVKNPTLFFAQIGGTFKHNHFFDLSTLHFFCLFFWAPPVSLVRGLPHTAPTHHFAPAILSGLFGWNSALCRVVSRPCSGPVTGDVRRLFFLRVLRLSKHHCQKQ